MGFKTKIGNKMVTKFYIFEKKNNIVGPLYHGSGIVFDKFSNEKLGSSRNVVHLMDFLGIHFTPDKKMAERLFSKPPNYVVYEVEIKVNKILKKRESQLVRDMLKWGGENDYVDKEFIEKNYLLYRTYSNITPFDRENKIISLNHFLLEDNTFDKKKLTLDYKQYLIEQGYDSIHYLNEIEWSSDERWDWIVFNDNQIKIINIYKGK